MNLWAELMETLSPFLSLDVLDTQSALFGFDVATNYLLKNHILLIAKLYIYQSRSKHLLRLSELISVIKKVANLEMLSESSIIANARKWSPLAPFLFT